MRFLLNVQKLKVFHLQQLNKGQHLAHTQKCIFSCALALTPTHVALA